MLIEAKAKYFQDLINNSKSSVKSLWDTVGNITKKRNKRSKDLGALLDTCGGYDKWHISADLHVPILKSHEI